MTPDRPSNPLFTLVALYLIGATAPAMAERLGAEEQIASLAATDFLRGLVALSGAVFLITVVLGSLDLFREPHEHADKKTGVAQLARWQAWGLCLVNLIFVLIATPVVFQVGPSGLAASLLPHLLWVPPVSLGLTLSHILVTAAVWKSPHFKTPVCVGYTVIALAAIAMLPLMQLAEVLPMG